MNSKESKNCSFYPDSFPGLIYRMKNPFKSTFLVFSNGNVVMVGLKSEDHVLTNFRAFYKVLKSYRVRDSSHL